MEINLLKSVIFKTSILVVIGLYNFCYMHSASSKIINNPTANMVNPTGWIALNWSNLGNNTKDFDTECEYRVTISGDQSNLTFIPTSIEPKKLLFKPSSKNRIARVNYDLKNIFIFCEDGNTPVMQRHDDVKVVKMEERCPNYMELYLNKKINEAIQGSYLAKLVVNMYDKKPKKSCCENYCAIL